MDLATLAAVSREDLYFALAVAATLATIALLVVTIRTDVRRSPALHDRRGAGARDPREALALVGDTLAATHNPEALLPVILRATASTRTPSGSRRGLLPRRRSRSRTPGSTTWCRYRRSRTS